VSRPARQTGVCFSGHLQGDGDGMSVYASVLLTSAVPRKTDARSRRRLRHAA
jgi:hypothetical protein